MTHQYSDDSESESGTSWVDWFSTQKGNEFYCVVDEDYILDRFNLAGLNAEIPHFQMALDLITDSLEQDLDPATWELVDKSAKHLYGLIHARWVITNKGLTMMAEKMKRKEFGRCPRVLCDDQPVIPVGITDVPGQKGVKLYCPRCEDIYTPSSKKQMGIDGAYFTTSLPHLVLQMYPALMPQKPVVRYEPKIFGFRIHNIAEVHRAQDAIREASQKKKNMMMEE
ncbi:casein kinase 2 regulatory subunit [Kappamyces sp. JEL0829]|nr:casein kinase 2 regulatory subunit [Kappamyces sp. JEL0829]